VGASHVTLPDFEGGTIDLELDPARRVGANAEARYDQARRREARAARAEAQVEALTAEAAEIDTALAALDTASDEALRTQAAELTPAREQLRRAAGLRYPAPHGFTVVVGRNSRENDEVTFKVARSLDVWLHVQGWTGSHVVVLAKGREVPFDVILFAARLAAGHSKAAGGGNVPVDYTLRKYVWKVKGAPPGAVHFAHQKTVYVTPSRDPTSETTGR
jgi:Predicted RNA-binding protein homologous to eukaryotic snRNP